ncbi:hypothetical protein [Caenimonas aquaedulcis]|uniref:Uncharacterized protein n=1 Tax=Caenimonas aquaedulcis TaxID=2793270 RepID=A0A931H836_9BURK|nr:hypothetical protein [Caenimonas aquaedulcis]MBG9390162.1 hypothetical protein [Caenimonas aquaedulcis]
MKALQLSVLIPVFALAGFTASGLHAQTKKLVTRDELRACMNSEAELADRRKSFEGRSAKNKEEADAIRAEQAEMAEEQKTLGDDQRKIDRFGRKVKAHNVKVQAAKANADAFNADLEALNKGLLAHNEKCGGISYDPDDKEAILKEREAQKK